MLGLQHMPPTLPSRSKLSRQLGQRPPQGVAAQPWFSVDGKDSRLLALRDSPPAFKNRNLFTPRVDLPLRLRAGRPPVSAEQKRRKNAERQRRAAELAALRQSAGLT